MKKVYGDKRYGWEPTALKLTEKAEKAYDETDPIAIIEHADGTYSVDGGMKRDGMTAEEVNEFFEELADEIARMDKIDELVELPFRDFLLELGLSQTECSRRFEIPLRTVQNWANGVNKCPDYTKRMIAELVFPAE